MDFEFCQTIFLHLLILSHDFFPLYFVNVLYYIDLWILKVAVVVKNPSASAGDARDMGSIPGSGSSPGVRSGNPLQYPCLENPLDRGAWWFTVHGVTKSLTRLSDFTLLLLPFKKLFSGCFMVASVTFFFSVLFLCGLPLFSGI